MTARLRKIVEAARSDSPRRQLWAVKQPDCPAEELLYVTSSSKYFNAAKSAYVHPNYPEEQLNALVASMTMPGWARYAIFQSQNLWPETITRAIKREECEMGVQSLGYHSTWVVGELLANPNCPVGYLRKYMDFSTSSDMLRRGIASNPNCPVRMQVRLAREGTVAVKVRLAGNPNLCPQARRLLLENLRGSYVTVALMKRGIHPDGTVETALAGGASNMVRRTVAETVDDPDVLSRLAFDPAKSVRKAVKKNVSAPDEAKVAVVLMGN